MDGFAHDAQRGEDEDHTQDDAGSAEGRKGEEMGKLLKAKVFSSRPQH